MELEATNSNEEARTTTTTTARDLMHRAITLLDSADASVRNRDPLTAGLLATEAAELLRAGDARVGASGVDAWGDSSWSWCVVPHPRYLMV